MTITDGFDGRHGKFYFISLVAMAFASALMLVAALRGAEPLQVPQEVGVSVAAFSLMCSTASYLLIGKIKCWFLLLGASAAVFSAALWSFGAPLSFVLLLGLPALLLSLISVIFRDKIDIQVEGDD
ncbi:hypothetical protein B9Y78_19260 [Stenotrophomonas maltophilia]|uniref:hypothetical protein n=1 Tax=Stenotrophomonas maltophilia TaxID=40324 RepID=UPI000CB6B5D1|nr:hypothetical protein [Stenotrophomonas maltophilia]MCF3538591.1 hypothetical protein [Stenotrophomonas maltophilia]MCF3551100.1 hypothetical protein [Stenotrophomonas maltophilia]MCF3559232.1 hypothetical protein [Stenotrophomonas maltophilia]MCF3562965.1 hypothetical protein [Stenotrophomonas maltophilia]MCU1109656.1 hypothetical protein [Stenotrophomonas maltophilia]